MDAVQDVRGHTLRNEQRLANIGTFSAGRSPESRGRIGTVRNWSEGSPHRRWAIRPGDTVWLRRVHRPQEIHLGGMARYILSPAAQADLEGIWDYTVTRWARRPAMSSWPRSSPTTS